jgi:hypothetical protein
MEIVGSGNAIHLQLSQSLSPQFTVNVENNDNINNSTIEKRTNDIDSDRKLRVIGCSRILSAPFQPTIANAVIVVDGSNSNTATNQLQSKRVQAEEVSYQNFQFPPLEKIKQLKFDKVLTYLSTHLPTYLLTYLPTYLLSCLSTHQSNHHPTYHPTDSSTYLPTYLLSYLHIVRWSNP